MNKNKPSALFILALGFFIRKVIYDLNGHKCLWLAESNHTCVQASDLNLGVNHSATEVEA